MSVSTGCYSQKKKNGLQRQCYLNIHFIKNDAIFKESTVHIDSVYKSCMKDIIAENRPFVLIPFSSTEEQKFDKYIGLKRCHVIINYFKVKYNIPESEFYINYSTDLSEMTNKSLEKGGRVACQTKW